MHPPRRLDLSAKHFKSRGFWRIDKPTAADDRIFDGIQLDTQGRVLGYWLDGQTFLDANALVHLFDLERYTQYRGMSPIRRGGE